jgi:pimeloyl-ACP methyl ester carboxylesterase
MSAAAEKDERPTLVSRAVNVLATPFTLTGWVLHGVERAIERSLDGAIRTVGALRITRGSASENNLRSLAEARRPSSQRDLEDYEHLRVVRCVSSNPYENQISNYIPDLRFAKSYQVYDSYQGAMTPVTPERLTSGRYGATEAPSSAFEELRVESTTSRSPVPSFHFPEFQQRDDDDEPAAEPAGAPCCSCFSCSSCCGDGGGGGGDRAYTTTHAVRRTKQTGGGFTARAAWFLARVLLATALVEGGLRGYAWVSQKKRAVVNERGPNSEYYYNGGNCAPGKVGDPFTQLPPTQLWDVPGRQFKMPIYSTHDLNAVGHWRIKHALIIQHGNLRNANEYFCGAVNSLFDAGLGPEKMASILVVAPLFPIMGDLCWDPSPNNVTTPARPIADAVNCGYPVWSNEGWKDGHLAVSSPSGEPMYSYDVFNALIDYLGDPAVLPNLRNITLFGFSAGAQTVLRYAGLTNYKIKNPHVTKVRYVVSDPSTFLYFTNERPFKTVSPTGVQEVSFQVPDASWITRWPWIPGWAVDCSSTYCCAEYNEWRFGLDNLSGYYAQYIGLSPWAKQNYIANFATLDITYLVGGDDNANCKLNPTLGCNDNELATYCPAMLQGDTRLDRVLSWKLYLKYLYGRDVHRIVFAEGIDHDAPLMIRSDTGRCTIMNICYLDEGTT